MADLFFCLVLTFQRCYATKWFDMKIVSLTCNHCGASLEVPQKTRFITCRYCSSRLEVKQSSGAIYTEVLEAIDEKTDKIVEDLEVLKLQSRLEQLDREWEVERDQYLYRGKHGETMVPTRGVIVAVGIIGCLFGLFWIILTRLMGVHILFSLFGIIIVVGVIAVIIKAVSGAKIYERRKKIYDSKREQLIARIRERGQTR
jgi:DNA-directed RNA polymerase subunit RPC12/RpoP